MQTDIIISGFGGQGVLFAGQLLSYAAMDSGLEVTWIPSYGPEMRGGTANCTVVISDEEIGSPLVQYPFVVLALNLPSLDKYEKLVRPDGLMVVNSSIIPREVTRRDIRVVRVPANAIAEQLGDKRVVNMVILGAMLGSQPVLTLEALEQAFARHMPARLQKAISVNVQALKTGAGYLAEAVKPA